MNDSLADGGQQYREEIVREGGRFWCSVLGHNWWYEELDIESGHTIVMAECRRCPRIKHLIHE